MYMSSGDITGTDIQMPSERVTLNASISSRVSFALHQNAVPFLHEVSITNKDTEPLDDLVLTLSSDPPFTRCRQWHLIRIGAGERYGLTDLDIDLDGGLLARLTEMETSEVTLTLAQEGRQLCGWVHQVQLLARNQWGGIGEVPELIAAFVQPNDPVVDRILKQAAEILRSNGREPALAGYTQGGKQRVWEMVSAVWGAVCALGLDYAMPPASFEHEGQKVRSPSQLIDGGVGTCLDTAVLFAACLEQCALHPLVVMLHGHAFSGCWLIDETFQSPVVDDVTLLRKREKLGDIVLFETTWATKRPAPTFSLASTEAMRQIAEDKEEMFQLAVDIYRARMHRIRPLASAEAVEFTAREAQSVEPVFEEAPVLGDTVIRPPIPTEQPTGRLDRWQRRLLDLSLRNSLLNFRTLRRSLTFDVVDPGRLEDRLSAGHELKLLPRPELMRGPQTSSWTIHHARYHEDPLVALTRDALGRNEVFIDLPEDEVNVRLVELYRIARASLEEGGANTLHLALGFLAWKRDEREPRRYRAPLILVPVSLVRRSVRSGFRLTLHDDEPRFNPTLIEMLRQDFNLSIPIVEGPLPKDESGLDVDGIWRAVGEAIKDVRGWEVLDEVVLSTFSFAKYLMWKDLKDRTNQLERNPVVHHLIHTPQEPYPSTVPFPDPRTLDATYEPATTYCPLSADSSQMTAVMAAASGKDFVLIGPPGTGKSQTIANLIAQCLAEGKTVLFIAEKTAALNVVYRRLQSLALGEFCLELHSNKARKLDVLAQLRRAWEAKGTVNAEEWRELAERLNRRRGELNMFVDHLHAVQPNGLSPFDAIGRVLTGQAVPRVALSWPSAETHDTSALNALRDVVDRLTVNGLEVGACANHPLTAVTQLQWSPGWQASLVAVARALLPLCTQSERATKVFADCIGLPDDKFDPRRRRALVALAEALPRAAGYDWRFVLTPDARELAERLTAAMAQVHRRADRIRALSVAYVLSAALELDLSGLRATWIQSQATWWPRSAFLRRRVRHELAVRTEVGVGADPACGRDLELLLEIRACDHILQSYDDLSAKTGGLWNGLRTRSGDVERVVDFERSLGRAMLGLVDDPASLSGLRHALDQLLGESNALLSPGASVAAAAERLVSAEAEFSSELRALVKVLGNDTSISDADPSVIADTCQAIVDFEPRLVAWCAWQRARHDATSLGLIPLVKAVEQGVVSLSDIRDAFEVNYCRWWLDALVDRDDVLRAFVPAEHEHRIAEFREVDDQFRQLTRSVIRARLCGNLPDQDDVTKTSAWGLLRRELEKKRRHMPLRQLFAVLGRRVLPRLAPCMLMSPLSIAQYLAPDAAPFDVVIFDEASQIPVWDAIGAIARGKRLVVVGDPKQLPPTSFFERSTSEDDDEDIEDAELESILDECRGANLPDLQLTWHYRSRHENLIAFSNHHYYEGHLVTFPSPVTNDRAVQYHEVPEGVYEKGGARVNRAEAIALVKHLTGRLRDSNFVATGHSIGVVTFNTEQQRLIEDMLDEERGDDPTLEPFFTESVQEPVFVKNLESVQGDERDVMYFSITYGPDSHGAVSLNFGPLNRDGGERRLNVAITRARCELHVFATLRPEQIDLARTRAQGVRDLKRFLQFAEEGPRSLDAAAAHAAGQFGSPFEEAVADAMVSKGWRVCPGVGVSSFRVGLGVIDPDEPEHYLAGIECDGPVYRWSPTARDRDKLREEVLRGLGWTIVRVWSAEWWINSTGAAEKLHGRLNEVLAAIREQRQKASEVQQVQAPRAGSPATQPGAVTSRVSDGRSILDVKDAPRAETPNDEPANASGLESFAPGLARVVREVASAIFQRADPADAVEAVNPDAFFAPTYAPSLMAMVRHTVRIEGPIRADVLARRIARAHGFRRAGARIRERIAKMARTEFRRTKEGVGEFFWPADSTTGDCLVFRRPGGTEPRSVDEISLAELGALARGLQRHGYDMEAGVMVMAQITGLQRLRAPSRARLEEAWRVVGGGV